MPAATTTRLKPKASLSLDLDNQWSYMKTHGDAGWQDFPSYLDIVVPRILDVLSRRKLTITFFVVGQDAALKKNHAALQLIAKAGHEIGNHSFHHEPWLHLYSKAQIEAEIAHAEEAIFSATGERTRGFRGPGFSVSADVLKVLKARKYLYDASTFPTFLGPLARAYYFLNARLPSAERKKRSALFGTLSEGFRPLKPYHWRLDNGPLLELPVTTMPLTRAPFHLSYALFLAQRSPKAARAYFNTALRLCQATGVEPSILLHPLDFLGGDDIDCLKFFPAMGMRGADKVSVAASLIGDLADRFDVLPIGAHVRHIEARGGLRQRGPSFPRALTPIPG